MIIFSHGVQFLFLYRKLESYFDKALMAAMAILPLLIEVLPISKSAGDLGTLGAWSEYGNAPSLTFSVVTRKTPYTGTIHC